MSSEQFERTVREYVAEKHDIEEVGVIEVRVRRPDGGILDLMDMEADGGPVSPATSTP